MMGKNVHNRNQNFPVAMQHFFKWDCVVNQRNSREKQDPVLSESSKPVVCRQTKHQKPYQLNNLSEELSSSSEQLKPGIIFPSQIKCSLTDLQMREHHLLNRKVHFAIDGFDCIKNWNLVVLKCSLCLFQQHSVMWLPQNFRFLGLK